MAKSLNQVTLLGNLTRDPELRQTPNGQNVGTFSLALNRSYKDKDGQWQEAADYIDVVAWGPLAERTNEYLSRGSRCLVVGRLQNRSWEKDGEKRSKVEVVANDVTFLDNKSDAKVPTETPDTETESTGDAEAIALDNKPISLDDIPF